VEPARILSLLEAVAKGDLAPARALEKLRGLPFEGVEEVARIDHHRRLRCGVPEVIFCPGKRPDDLARIAHGIVAAGSDLLATRADPTAAAAIRTTVPDAVYHERARCVVRRREGAPPPSGSVLVVSAGTSDIPVAEEARVTAETFGSAVETLFDCGVAGIHRLLSKREALERANAIVVVAGMEGALASVVGGLVSKPVVAVPTSIGYGASFGGLAALLSMLNSCAAHVSVVNIDNGFGAGTIAHAVNRAIVEAALGAGD
jgi:hypothetical protein